jgi:hypothetical protein
MTRVATEHTKRQVENTSKDSVVESAAKRIRSTNGGGQSQPSAFEEELQKLTQEIRDSGTGKQLPFSVTA